MYKMRYMSAFLMLCLAMANAFAANSKEFPGRDIYLGTDFIELEDFRKQFDNAIVVDVRSEYEFDTLSIKGAYNIPLHSASFVSKMQDLRNEFPAKKIVVYCNGKTCMKSYKAASKCKSRGIDGVVAFDAGIMDWAKSYPSLSVLLGESPIDPDKLITKETFKKHLVSPEIFSEQAQAPNVIVLDVRDRYQRQGLGLFVGKEVQASLDNFNDIKKFIDEAKATNKTLLIYDEAGKQVRWLMYRIERAGLTNYQFMDGGTRKYFSMLKNRMKKAS